MEVKVEKQPKATIKLTVTVPAEQVKTTYNHIFDELVKNSELPGFRKGMAPKEMVKEKTDVSKLYGDVVNELLEKYYPQAIKENLISPVSNPKVEIKEFDLEKDFQFIATVAVRPEVKIGDYKTKLKEAYTEIDEKRRRVVANREIVKKGLSLEQIKKYLVEDGADVNTQRGQALDNAISEVNAEKVKYLLDFGASPNMRQKQEASVNKISDIEDSTVAFEILKYMLNAGAELTPTVFKGLLGDYNAVKFCLDNGLDPNFEDNLAIRLSIKKGLFDVFKLLVDKGAVIANRGLNIAWAYESGNRDILEFLIEKGYTQNIDKSMAWIGHSPKLSIEKRIEILKELQEFIDAGKVIPSENGYRINDGKDLRRNVSYKEVIDKYGNLFNWVVAQNPDTLGAKLKKR
jgi:ankyrin repeat protein